MRTSIAHPSLTTPEPLVSGAVSGPCLIARCPAAGSRAFTWVAGPAPQPQALLVSEATTAFLAAMPSSGGSWSALPRPVQIRAAIALAADGVRPTEIARLLGHPNTPEVWRWAALAEAHPSLRDAVLDGSLTPGHLRPILRMPLSDQADWTARARRGRWSVRQLAAAVKSANSPAPAFSSADVQSVENALTAQLGCGVRLKWSDAPGAMHSLSIDWCDVESLKGVIERLAAGPEASAQRPVIARQLVIALANAEELGALTDHLIEH